MRQGYFIGMGDKTTCGGKVLDGDPTYLMSGLAQACEGDRVTCGKDGKIYQIIGGISHMTDYGRRLAGTLDSMSSCRCKAQLIPSISTATYSNESTASQATVSAAQSAAPGPASGPATPGQSDFAVLGNPAPAPLPGVQKQEPGFYVVPKSMSREALNATLFTSHDAAVMSKFRALNPNLGSEIKAGTMILLGDPNNMQCTREEALLMEAATKTNDALKPLNAEEADFMVRHRDEIETFLAQSSTAIGIGEVMFAKHLRDVKTVLHDIEALHQRAFKADGHLRSPDFFAERKRLLAKLDTNLTALTRKGIGFPDHPNLKSALGVSSRSLVHNWSKAGAAGQIPGYATHIEGVTKAAQIIKYGGWVGTAIGGAASYLKVQDVCAAGNADACKKAKFIETGGFAGSVIGGAVAGGLLSTPLSGAICIGLGVPTGGLATLVCGVVVVGVGSLAGGAAGGKGVEHLADVIYEAVK